MKTREEIDLEFYKLQTELNSWWYRNRLPSQMISFIFVFGLVFGIVFGIVLNFLFRGAVYLFSN
jgi:hypothetical protein